MQDLAAERWASLKTGISSGLIAAIGGIAFAWATALMLRMPLFLIDLALNGSLTGFSGFLFGITYRYVVRQGVNAHLSSGTVGAFGLVRGLASLQPQLLTFLHQGLPWATQGLTTALIAALTLGQNLALFALCRWSLDFAFDRQWLQRFPIPMPAPISSKSLSIGFSKLLR
jgi:hypothetical protein